MIYRGGSLELSPFVYVLFEKSQELDGEIKLERKNILLGILLVLVIVGILIYFNYVGSQKMWIIDVDIEKSIFISIFFI